MKRVQKVIGKNEEKKNADYFVFYKDSGEYFVVVNLTSNTLFMEPFTSVMMTSRFKDPNQCELKVIIIVYNLQKEADKFMTIGQ